jgi:hypothetical protein
MDRVLALLDMPAEHGNLRDRPRHGKIRRSDRIDLAWSKGQSLEGGPDPTVEHGRRQLRSIVVLAGRATHVP